MPATLAEILEPIMRAHADIEQRLGQEGYRAPFDKALHVYAALKQAGFKVVRKPKARGK